MRALLLALILGTVGTICWGQAVIGTGTPQQNTKRYTVSGSVSNSVTGEPIRRALVQIGQFSAFSGADGRFQIDGVAEGQYSASAQRPGFFDPGQAGIAPAGPSMVTVGPNTPPIALSLIPESVIEGRVVRNTGEPVENALIQAISEQIFSGRKTLQSAGAVNTDDAGEFRIENLMPGKYYVQVSQLPVFGWGYGMVAVGSNRQVYPEQFYPNAPDLASAQALELTPGKSAEADFTLSPKPAVRISGVLATAARNGLFVTMQDASGEETQANILFNPRTGHWMLPFVPPGAWNIVFRAQDQPGDAYYAEQRIEVRASDIENVRIVLQPLPPISVQVVNAPDAANQTGPVVGVSGVQLRLIPQNSQRLNRQEYMATPSGGDPGALSIPNVAPGAYSVVVQSNGAGCIDSVASGSIDLTRDPLVVALGSPPAPIQVALRNDCASLDVTLQSQERGATQALILVSDSPAFEPKIAYLTAGSHTVFGALSPGVYRLYAVTNPNKLEYTNAEAMRDLNSQEITLTPNQQASVSANAATGSGNE